jgi:proteasome lid subunit RPN8/RPN11
MKLKECLEAAVAYGDSGGREEVGGLILTRNDEFRWVPLHNQHAGTYTAFTVFEPTHAEYTAKIMPLLREGWKRHGSFHSHPSFSYHPSYTDYGSNSALFLSYHINYIYSVPEKCVAKYTWLDDNQLKQEITRDLDQWLTSKKLV